ncbi:MAG: helix-turn-helix domain-containing protein [Candidatus Brocadiia bacterium]
MITVSDTLERLLSIKEVADFLGLHQRTVYTLANEGRIPGFKLGGAWRFDLRTIKNWVNREMTRNCHRPSA